MRLKRLSCLILLIVLIDVAFTAAPKPKGKKAGRNLPVNPKSKQKLKPGVRGRFDEHDEVLDPQEPAGNKPSPEETGETTHATGVCKALCVPYYLCSVNNSIVDDGSGIIDPRSKPPPKNEIPLDAGKSGICSTFETCCSDPEKPDKDKPSLLPYVHRCGIRYPSGINRRVLSSKDKGESEFGEWPWQAAILKGEEGDTNLFVCGGVLINDLYVLTVGHCVVKYYPEGFDSLKIRLGEWDTQNTEEFLPHEDYKVVDVFIHEEYRNSSLWNDIAVLKLDRPVKYQLNIDTICLPGPDEIFESQKCVTTGWGKSAYQGGSYSNILKEVSLPVISHHECQDGLRTTRLGPRFRLHPSFVCAGGEEGKDSCKGDGGGPLACYRKDGTYALVGLVSWGIDCGKPGVPGVYVDVRKYIDWISVKTGLDSRAFKPNKKVQ